MPDEINNPISEVILDYRELAAEQYSTEDLGRPPDVRQP